MIPACLPDKKEVRMNRFYREGPHILKANQYHRAMSFSYKNGKWSTELQNVEPHTRSIEVQTPIDPPFQVLTRENKPFSTYTFRQPARLFIISDLEGNYVGLTSLLQGNKVIDEEGNWSFGQNHLIMLGDLFDRGPDVTPVLWLLYKLEQQAQKKGGNVHVILGNHEIMIFQGDVRYIHRKYQQQEADTNIPYVSLYAPNTVLGAWLRSKPAIIRVGTSIYTHAGISPELFSHKIDLNVINELIRDKNLETNEAVAWQDPRTSALFGGKGLFWYRNWIEETPDEDQLDKILTFYKAKTMVIGHTIVSEPTFYHQKKLLAVDVQQPKQLQPGKFRAVIQENGIFYEVNDLGIKKEIQKLE